MITGFLFLLFLMGGNASIDIEDDQQTPNETITTGGNDSMVDLQDYQEMFNETFTIGGNKLIEEVLVNNYLLNETIIEYEPIKDRNSICSYLAIINHLNLTQDKDRYITTRPVKKYSEFTKVYQFMAVKAILDVRETDQSLVSYIWVEYMWWNDHIFWKPHLFCGLRNISFPTAKLWMPDITIEERIDQDKEKSPYLLIYYYSLIKYTNEQVVTTACRMHVYKFPFDVQRCNITFKSIVHGDNEIKLVYNENNEKMTNVTRTMIENQYEWIFENLTITNKSNIMYPHQTTVVYTITMRRRSVLYIANFISPVLFFLVLDLASFLIPDAGGEKLSFKVTVLLAVTVLQLLLNEILPSSSDKVPLIAIYCIGIFTLMLLSLLETILMMHLIEKDPAAQHNEMDEEQSPSSNCGDKWFKANFHSCVRGRKSSDCASVCDESADETQSVTKERSNGKLTEVSLGLEQVSAELREIGKTMSLLSSNGKEEKFGYWARMVKKINKAFFICYLTAITIFLSVMFSLWTS